MCLDVKTNKFVNALTTFPFSEEVIGFLPIVYARMYNSAFFTKCMYYNSFKICYFKI